MSIAAFSVSELPLSAQPAAPAPVRKPPPKRQFVARPDSTAAPEPR